MKYLILLMFIFNYNVSVAAKSYQVTKNISYANEHTRQTLDIYSPKSSQQKLDVLIYVHGGSWDSGSKDTYKFMGKNFAKNNVLFVPINYRLAPEVSYQDMALDVAKAVQWVAQNIENYGGNPERIFISGHSAGAHLLALAGLDKKYFERLNFTNPIKGMILIDAFCLDLHDYFTITAVEWAKRYYYIFSTDPERWQDASPINYINNANFPIQAFVGTKTYPAIMLGTDRFRVEALRLGKDIQYIQIEGKRHVGMIAQMIFPKNNMYEYILKFMRKK